jgi:hypothetical protein
VADLTFFTLVWPHDATRRLVWQGGADAWFWIRAAQAVIFTALAVLAFRWLARVTKTARAARRNTTFARAAEPLAAKNRAIP